MPSSVSYKQARRSAPSQSPKTPTSFSTVPPDGCKLLLLKATNTNLKAVNSCNRIRFFPNNGCEIFSNTASFNHFDTSYFVTLPPPVGNYQQKKQQQKTFGLCIWTTSLLALWEVGKIPCFLPDGTSPKSFRFYSCIPVVKSPQNTFGMLKVKRGW